MLLAEERVSESEQGCPKVSKDLDGSWKLPESYSSPEVVPYA